jgi:hypothetical protein
MEPEVARLAGKSTPEITARTPARKESAHSSNFFDVNSPSDLNSRQKYRKDGKMVKP